MTGAELEALIRARLAGRDRACVGRLFHEETFRQATDRFVAEVMAAAGYAAPEPAGRKRAG